MYIFTYASSDQSTDELYAEYHLGRRAFRACKKGTKFCGWDRHMPAFHHWQHLCRFTLSRLISTWFLSWGLLCDAMKDQYKVISDGEKVDSGSWSDNPYVSYLMLNCKPSLSFLVGWPRRPPHPWTGSRCRWRRVWQVIETELCQLDLFYFCSGDNLSLDLSHNSTCGTLLWKNTKWRTWQHAARTILEIFGNQNQRILNPAIITPM